MRLYITRQDTQAQYLGSQQHDDTTRRYYELVGQVVDAAVGWDVAQPGFVLDERRIGTRRTKISIHRPLDVRRGRYPSLSEQIKR